MAQKQGTASIPAWAELGTHHLPDAAAFYESMFGWSLEELPPGRDGVYAVFKGKEGGVAGLFELSEHEPLEKPGWIAYFSVENIENSVRRAEELGARIDTWPTEMPALGRWAMVTDPTGAVFALWQSFGRAVQEPKGEAGTLAWAELDTNDADRAVEFYTQLFGWKAQTSTERGGRTYTSFYEGESMVAGMMQAAKHTGQNPHWLLYFHTHDTDAGVSSAKDMGGEVLQEPKDIPQVGRFSILRDPQGALFAVIRRDTIM